MPRRTVRCSWCGESGHNSSGCQAKKDFIARNPGSYWAQRAEAKAQRRKNSAKHRQCSWCKGTGHNARSCSLYKSHFETARKLNAAFRRAFLIDAQNLGFHKGAMLRDVSTTRREGHIALVADVNLSSVRIGNLMSLMNGRYGDEPGLFDFVWAQELGMGPNNRSKGWGLETVIMDIRYKDKERRYTQFEIVGGEAPKMKAPAAWLDGKEGISDLMKAFVKDSTGHYSSPSDRFDEYLDNQLKAILKRYVLYINTNTNIDSAFRSPI
jgi:hypothetical protein